MNLTIEVRADFRMNSARERGRGLYCTRSSIVLTGGSYSSNTAWGFVGMLFIEKLSNLIMTQGVQVSDNNAPRGGCLHAKNECLMT